ncbi:MAG TPA: hypothetical protein VFI02_06100 [Armatimonadota bacterium]|nr:hypothetical protein [Armatimonadota bacterium]
MTSAGRPGDGTRCQDLHISHYLVKPVKQSELLNLIMSCLDTTQHHSLQDELLFMREELENRATHDFLTGLPNLSFSAIASTRRSLLLGVIRVPWR